MTKKHLLWAIGIVALAALVIGGGYWAYWNFVTRYNPVVITKYQKEIQTLLDSSGYVSSGNDGPVLWVVTYRNCEACKTWEDQELPKFAAVGADIRIIPFAPADVQGQSHSTASERATIAQIWLERSYTLYRYWRASPEDLWKPADIRPADGDLARTAVVAASRDFVAQLGPLLKANQVPSGYPLVIWRDAEERIKVCACTDERMYRHVRADFGAPDKLTIPPVISGDGMASSASASEAIPDTVSQSVSESATVDNAQGATTTMP
ncbi:MAG: hypothetical protein QM645_06225 [Asticcacaulis sp.]